MIITAEAVSSLRTLDWFHPARVNYHVQRYFKHITELCESGAIEVPPENIRDLSYLRYVFSYSRLLVAYAMYYINALRKAARDARGVRALKAE